MLIVISSLRGFVADLMGYDLESAKYLWWSYDNSNK